MKRGRTPAAASESFGLAGLIVGCGREMRHQAFELYMWSITQDIQNGSGIGIYAQPAHPAIHFQVTPVTNVAAACEPVQLQQIRKGMDHRRKFIREHSFPSKWQKISHHEDAGFHAAIPQCDAFFGITYREPLSAARFEHF
jgi:hypothetical protein